MEIGDKIQIINHGYLSFVSKERWENEFFPHTQKEKPDNIIWDKYYFYVSDVNPELIGEKGIIVGKNKFLFLDRYEILFNKEGIGKMNSFFEYQLKLIN